MRARKDFSALELRLAGLWGYEAKNVEQTGH